MNTFWWIVIVYVVGIFVVGLPTGKKALKVWTKSRESENGSGGFWGLVLFPSSSLSNVVGTENTYYPLPILASMDFNNKKSKQGYVGFVGIFWPFHTLIRIFILTVLGLAASIYFSFLFVSRLLGKLVKV